MITPLRDYYLLEPAEAPALPSGLHLVRSEDLKVKTAKVKAVGTGVKKQYFVPQHDGSPTAIVAPDPDTHVFYVNVGYIPPGQVEEYMEKVKEAVRYPKLEADTTVLYDAYGAHEVMDSDGKRYVLANERQILAVIS